ncbi:neprilysin-1-like [Lineus longissimus]|uniref:neprilysin-1-like n=1 Tax=Lineus longissimus TaxID=88925 RepID=UPI00315C70B8
MDLPLLWTVLILLRTCLSLPVDDGGTARGGGSAGGATKGIWNERAEPVDLAERLAGLEALSENNLIRRIREVKSSVQASSPSSLIDSELVGSCDTQHCQETASEMLRTMDQTKPPCDDFYHYACGNWAANNPIPDTFGSYSSFVKLREVVEGKLRALLEAPALPDEPSAVAKAKLMYQACVDETTIENRGDTPFRELIENLGSWPILEGDAWDEDAFDLLDTLVKGRKMGNSALMYLVVGTDYKVPTERVLKLDQGGLSLPSRDYYFHLRNSSNLMAYEDYAYSVAKKLGVPENRARREASDMVDFEIKLANLTLKREQRRDVMALYDKMSIGELKRRIPQFDWLRFINGVLADVINAPVTEEEPIIVLAEDYLKKMMSLVESTPKRTVANYVMSILVKDSIMDLSSDFRQLLGDYKRQMFGVQKNLPRWHTCVQLTDQAIPSAVGRIFVERYFDEGSKHEVTEMLSMIGDVMKMLLDEAPWMDKATTRVAKEKADDMVHLIGYPDRILDDDELEQEYSRLNVNRLRHFENVLQSIAFKSDKYLRKLREPVARSKWDATRPADVNAYYDPTKNHLVFPAAVLQEPFYNKNNPNYMNYGGIGMVIGHEITHGFDDLGRQFDGDGKLHHWWDQETIRHFKNKTQCMVEQYGNYRLDSVNMNVNGLLTQGENIADNGGLKEAFRAYQKWVQEHGPEQRLPGLNLTQTQLFFLNFAQIWCSNARPEMARNHILADNHSPTMFRVIGPLSNLDAFSKAYNCPLGSKMNPVDKCSIW